MEFLNGINALTLVFVALLVFAIAYRFYGIFMANKVLRLNAKHVTPAIEFADGKDYVATNKNVLFGHLFASVRHKGESLATIARKEIGKGTGLIAGLAILFILVLTLAGLSLACISAMHEASWSLFTVIATMPIAILMGLIMRYRKDSVT